MANTKRKCAKRRFRTEIDAKIALAKIKWQDKPHRPKIETRVYKCPLCHGFHLTSKEKATF